MSTTTSSRRRRRGLAAALALAASVLAGTVQPTPATAAEVPGDALVFAPTSALTNLVWRAGMVYTFAVGTSTARRAVTCSSTGPARPMT